MILWHLKKYQGDALHNTLEKGKNKRTSSERWL